MKIIQINSVPNYSTGKIALAISRIVESKDGDKSYLFYSHGNCDFPHVFKFANVFELFIHKCLSHLFGKYGFYGKFVSRRILRRIRDLKPDIVHVHNIHSHDFDFRTFFIGLKKSNIKVVYTFHDCWAFTGYCPYFDFIGCEKWKLECKKCPLKNKYSLLFDRSNYNQRVKKNILDDLDLTIVSPSYWLDNLVGQSFLKEKKRKVIHNGIDLSIFKPTVKKEILNKYGLLNKKFVLAVAAVWEKRKGFSTLLQISEQLRNKALVVVVGRTPNNAEVIKHNNVKFINRTDDQIELSCLYSSCVCLINPTLEDNYPTVNLECISCGKPVVCYDSGGCRETINDKTGILVKKGDYKLLLKSVLSIINGEKQFLFEDCLKYSKQFDQKNCFKAYIELYNELLGIEQ